jgi:hypothetical protein
MGGGREGEAPRFYWNLVKARGALEKGDTPFTPAINLVLGSHAAMKLMDKEGRLGVFARHQRNADATRHAVHTLGLPLFAEVPSNALTAIEVPAGVDGGAVVKTMEQRYGVKIAGGQDQLKGKIFRLWPHRLLRRRRHLTFGRRLRIRAPRPRFCHRGGHRGARGAAVPPRGEAARAGSSRLSRRVLARAAVRRVRSA